MSLVIAISADKDWKSMMRMIAPYADKIYVTRFGVPGRQSADPRSLLSEAKKHARKSSELYLYSDPLEAFYKARKDLPKNGVLLITGSFYLAGDIRSLYCPESRILKQRNSGI